MGIPGSTYTNNALIQSRCPTEGSKSGALQVILADDLEIHRLKSTTPSSRVELLSAYTSA